MAKTMLPAFEIRQGDSTTLMVTVARGRSGFVRAAGSDAASEPLRFSQIEGFQVNRLFWELKTEANLHFNQPIIGRRAAAAATATESTEPAGARI